jgi:hypothetical protein
MMMFSGMDYTTKGRRLMNTTQRQATLKEGLQDQKGETLTKENRA